MEDQNAAQISVPPCQKCINCSPLFPSPCQGEVDARPRVSGEGPHTARDFFRARFKILSVWLFLGRVRMTFSSRDNTVRVTIRLANGRAIAK